MAPRCAQLTKLERETRGDERRGREGGEESEKREEQAEHTRSVILDNTSSYSGRNFSTATFS